MFVNIFCVLVLFSLHFLSVDFVCVYFGLPPSPSHLNVFHKIFFVLFLGYIFLFLVFVCLFVLWFTSLSFPLMFFLIFFVLYFKVIPERLGEGRFLGAVSLSSMT